MEEFKGIDTEDLHLLYAALFTLCESYASGTTEPPSTVHRALRMKGRVREEIRRREL
jgi:hypothetical protein